VVGAAPALQDYLQAFLLSRGYPYVLASSPEEALDSLAQRNFRFTVVDLDLDPADPADLIRRLKAQRGEPGPVIGITPRPEVARAIQSLSARRTGAFVKVNCAAVPRELLESELFGHERGAFTGAHKQEIGKFEAAHNGTIFLDEIGDLHPTLQAKLLHVLQDG